MASLFVLLEMEIGSLRRQRIFRDRLNPLDAYSDVEFIARYRIRREMFLELHDKIETFMSRSTSRSHSLSVTTQLAVTLQFLATGSFQTVVASAHGISQPSVSNCVRGVTDALCSIAKEYIQFPTAARQMRMQHEFMEKFGFPKVLGCIDGSHIPIVAPSTNEAIYVNRKSYHSINVQAICDDVFKFIDVVVKWPGSTHDAFIWRQSGINLKIASKEIPIIDGWFLGDSGYPLRPNLMTPLLSPVTPRERRYNHAFLKTRKTIEYTFGIWKSRWRSMDKTGGSLCYSPERVCKLILSSMKLHNFCIDCRLQIDIENLESDMPYTETDYTEHSDNGILVRENIIRNYFT